MELKKQIIYISRKSKELYLEVELFNLQKASLQNKSCLYFEVYKSDECKEEFLVYEEWQNEEDYEKNLKTKAYFDFMKKYDELVLKKENLPII